MPGIDGEPRAEDRRSRQDISPIRPAASNSEFGQVFSAHTGYMSDKWVHYLTIYERKLGEFVARGIPLRLLEIGYKMEGP